jgi:hypothetical protein
VKLAPGDAPLTLLTVTQAVPDAAVRLAGITAVTCVGLT